MVLLNQRFYYENTAQGETGIEELGTLGTQGPDRDVGSEATTLGAIDTQIYSNPGSAGEIFVTQFPQVPAQIELECKASDDATFDQVKWGVLKVIHAR